MKLGYLPVFILLLFINSCDSGPLQFSSKKLENHEDTISYSLGINIATKLKKEGVYNINSEAFKLAMEHVLSNDSNMLITPDEAIEILKNYFTDANKDKNAKNLYDAQTFLEKNKKEKNVHTTSSGLQYIIQQKGDGKKPVLEDIVTVHYKGYLLSGDEFDNTYSGNPVSFPINSSPKAWQEILPEMSVGTKLKLFVHPDLGYGSTGSGDKIEPNMLLIYEIELISIDNPTK